MVRRAAWATSSGGTTAAEEPARSPSSGRAGEAEAEAVPPVVFISAGGAGTSCEPSSAFGRCCWSVMFLILGIKRKQICAACVIRDGLVVGKDLHSKGGNLLEGRPAVSR